MIIDDSERKHPWPRAAFLTYEEILEHNHRVKLARASFLGSRYKDMGLVWVTRGKRARPQPRVPTCSWVSTVGPDLEGR